MLQNICENVSRNAKQRPVHILYLSSGENTDDGCFVGSFQMVSLQPAEAACEVPACQSSCSFQHCSASEMHSFPSHLTVHPETHIPVCGIPVSHSAPLVDDLMKRDFMNVSTETLGLVRGAQVLARRATDGYYYLGHIAQAVEGTGSRFLLEFEKSRKQKGKAQLRMQETSLYDIIHYEDARRQPLVPGDRVLAPLDGRGERYGPGRVLQGVECRAFASDVQSDGVLVTFWNGRTRQVPPDMAVRIPIPLSDRIVLELQMPPSARQKLVDCSPGYPCSVPPGYRPSGSCGQPVCAHDAPWTQPCGALNHAGSCQVGSTVWPALNREKDPVSGSNPRRDRVSKKKDQQLNPEKGSLSESPTSKEKKKKKKLRVGHSSDRQSENDLKMSPVSSRIESILTSDAVVWKDGMNPAERPVQAHGYAGQPCTEDLEDHSMYSGPDLSEVSSLQAILKQIDRSLKNDRLLMEAALPERRPRSAPNSQRCIWKSAKSEELRKKMEADKADEWRRHEEHRQQQKERELEIKEHMLQQWELEIREQLQQEAQRQKSPQRSHEFKRQTQGTGKIVESVKSPGTLKIFRNRQEEKKAEEEEEEEEEQEGHPGFKVQHVRTVQKLRDEPDSQYSKKNTVLQPTNQETMGSRRRSPQNRPHYEPKEQKLQHSSKHHVSPTSGHFSHEMKQEKEMLQGRWQSPQQRSESKNQELDRKTHHHQSSKSKTTNGREHVSGKIEQDMLRGRSQSPRHMSNSKAKDVYREYALGDSSKQTITKEDGLWSQEMEHVSEMLRGRRQSPQHNSEPNAQDLDRRQQLRHSSKLKETERSEGFSQEIKKEKEMLRNRRQSPHHNFELQSQDSERGQQLRHSSTLKATPRSGDVPKENKQENDVLRDRWQSPQQKFQSDPKEWDRERNWQHSSKPKGNGLVPQQNLRKSANDQDHQWQKDLRGPTWPYTMLS
ncbi:peptidyl-prolyl cis-trans isomerase G-like isoform X2 [Ambystoma mexicanum]